MNPYLTTRDTGYPSERAPGYFWEVESVESYEEMLKKEKTHVDKNFLMSYYKLTEQEEAVKKRMNVDTKQEFRKIIQKKNILEPQDLVESLEVLTLDMADELFNSISEGDSVKEHVFLMKTMLESIAVCVLKDKIPCNIEKMIYSNILTLIYLLRSIDTESYKEILTVSAGIYEKFCLEG